MKENRRYERIAREVRDRRAGCPDADDLQAYVEESLGSPVKERVASHVATCDACAEAIRFLEAERAGVVEESEVPPDVVARDDDALDRLLRDAARAPRRTPRVWIGAAAAGLLVAAVLGAWLLDRDGRPAGFREAGASSPVRALVPDGAVLSRGDLVLRWSAPEGSRCDVLVFAEDLRHLARGGGITAGEWRVPEAALATVPEGGKVFWQVEALLPDGTRVVSPARVVSLR